MGLLDDLYATELGAIKGVPGTTRANYDKLKGLLGVDATGNGLLSDIGYGARNAVSQAKWNAGNRLDKIQQYLTDPSARFQPSTPESRAAIDESLMNLGSSVMPGAMGGVTKLVDYNLIKAPAKSNQLSATRKQVGGNRITIADPSEITKWEGIYGNPAEIARSAAEHTTPESPWLKELFGVTRPDLVAMSEQMTGNETPYTNFAAKPKGSKIAPNVITPQNTQRIVDTLAEADKYPDLRAMRGWYMMHPAYQMLEKEYGPDQAVNMLKRFNAFTGMTSPGSDVISELNRGSAANYLDNQGQFDLFQKFAGYSDDKRGAGFPDSLRDVIGHPYHKTAHVSPMLKYLDSGEVQMESPKVPLYIQSSGVPETGFQTQLPVGDAHFVRGIGLAHARPWKNVKGESMPNGDSITNTELQTLGDWYRGNIGGALGWESVPTQAMQWGALHQQTGVKTPVGAPKLELIADQVAQDALRRGLDPRRHVLDVLSGRNYIGRGNWKGLLEDD